MSQGNRQDEGIMSWVLLSACCLGVMGFLCWLVGKHYIVFYLTPAMDVLAFPWKLLPSSWTGSVVPDLNFNYHLFRQKPHLISFGDWLGYVNVALKPWAILFAAAAVWMFRRQNRFIKDGRMNVRLSPTQLAHQMMNVFTDIAPVVSIQEKLIRNEIKGWARQVFPEEFLKKAKYQGKPVLVPDNESGELIVDYSRLEGYLQETRTFTHGNVKLLKSRHLGRQIVDISSDSKSKNNVVFVDRLSDSGKAIFAILAPYAFNASKGKIQSKEVSDALNLSAFGSAKGMANLSIDEAQASFNTWREHPLARKLAKIHQWEHTFLFALLEHAQRSGKIGTWNFIWLKPTDRIMFYVLNTVGRKTPHSEAAMAFSQLQYERKTARLGNLPIDGEGKPIIYTKKVVDSLNEEWEFWRNGDEDTEDWWQDPKLSDWDQNVNLMQDLRKINEQSTIPPGAI